MLAAVSEFAQAPERCHRIRVEFDDLQDLATLPEGEPEVSRSNEATLPEGEPEVSKSNAADEKGDPALCGSGDSGCEVVSSPTAREGKPRYLAYGHPTFGMGEEMSRMGLEAALQSDPVWLKAEVERVKRRPCFKSFCKHVAGKDGDVAQTMAEFGAAGADLADFISWLEWWCTSFFGREASRHAAVKLKAVKLEVEVSVKEEVRPSGDVLPSLIYDSLEPGFGLPEDMHGDDGFRARVMAQPKAERELWCAHQIGSAMQHPEFMEFAMRQLDDFECPTTDDFMENFGSNTESDPLEDLLIWRAWLTQQQATSAEPPALEPAPASTPEVAASNMIQVDGQATPAEPPAVEPAPASTPEVAASNMIQVDGQATPAEPPALEPAPAETEVAASNMIQVEATAHTASEVTASTSKPGETHAAQLVTPGDAAQAATPTPAEKALAEASIGNGPAEAAEAVCPQPGEAAAGAPCTGALVAVQAKEISEPEVAQTQLEDTPVLPPKPLPQLAQRTPTLHGFFTTRTLIDMTGTPKAGSEPAEEAALTAEAEKAKAQEAAEKSAGRDGDLGDSDNDKKKKDKKKDKKTKDSKDKDSKKDKKEKKNKKEKQNHKEDNNDDDEKKGVNNEQASGSQGGGKQKKSKDTEKETPGPTPVAKGKAKAKSKASAKGTPKPKAAPASNKRKRAA